MPKRNLQILIDNQKTVYFPGDTITGRVQFDVDEPLKVRSIVLKFVGWANVHWTEQRSSGKSSHTVHFRSHEDYFNFSHTLLSRATTGSDEIVLSPNSYTYPFSVTLPYNIPSSYEAYIGQVRYIFIVDVDIPWAFDIHAKHMITVMDPLDLNTIPNLESRAEKTDQKVLCCCCCASDPISAHVRLERQGYVPGEEIPFWAEINNQSNRTMSCSKARLLMSVSYHATSKTRIVQNYLTQIKHGEIEGGGTEAYVNEKLHIPVVPPSFLKNCRIIDIRYYVVITVDPSGLGFDLHVPVEVVIGSIPLRSVAQQHGLALPDRQAPIAPIANLPPPPPPYLGAPAGLYDDIAYPPALPQTTFAQSALGAHSTAEAGDTEHTYGNTNFAPVYTYYDWSKPSNNTTQFEIEG
ncbi:arrestin domain-containing protein 3-like [Dreissena polymorpha]|uniref:Arrestin C-terminal-like domain-containing protein n=1 Tax=Dreissena polymorpha TaxID=45954 RepID=A0A9D4KCG4_DREPO|nr:arrestin domain-containing protein 3-like [Dreissena polymorpha]KAH3836787.1 hypothetical protein DPMN_110162 [Dreissena polymorpha]